MGENIINIHGYDTLLSFIPDDVLISDVHSKEDIKKSKHYVCNLKSYIRHANLSQREKINLLLLSTALSGKPIYKAISGNIYSLFMYIKTSLNNDTISIDTKQLCYNAKIAKLYDIPRNYLFLIYDEMLVQMPDNTIGIIKIKDIYDISKSEKFLMNVPDNYNEYISHRILPKHQEVLRITYEKYKKAMV